MSDIPFNYGGAEALLRGKRETLVKPGTRLDRQFLIWCREGGFSGTEILSLFPRGGEGRRGARYRCDVRCPICQTWRVEELGISGLRELISVAKTTKPLEFDFRFRCRECEEAALRERVDPSQNREAVLAHLRAETAQKRRTRAEAVVAHFLSPTNRWRDDIPSGERFERLTCETFDAEFVAAAIRRMTWPDFFKTPYWEAVHGEALRRVRAKCVVCAGAGPLRIHYRTHDLHGFEHTDEGMRELLFLCNHCELTSALKTKLDRN